MVDQQMKSHGIAKGREQWRDPVNLHRELAR